MEFEKLEKQLLATAKAFRAFKTEFGYGKSGEELLKPFFRSLEESLGAVETEFDFLIGKDTVNIDGKSFGACAEAFVKQIKRLNATDLSGYADELNGFLIISFLISALAAGICAVIALKRKKAEQNDNADGEEKPAKGVGYFLPIVLSGVGVALNNVINLYLSGKVDSAVFFPIVNGGGLILVTLCAVVLYREKLSVKQWAGIIIGIISVVLLSNP